MKIRCKEIKKEWLEEKYLIEKHTIKQIAELAKCSTYHIKQWLKFYNITFRSSSEELSLGVKYATQTIIDTTKIYSNKEWLYDQYWTQMKSPRQIAEEINADYKDIYKYLKLLDIKIKNKVEARIGQKHSKETKQKMSDSHKNIDPIWLRGKSMSDKNKQLVSDRMKGNNNPMKNPEVVLKVKSTKLLNNYKISQETKQKISQSLTGRIFTPEHIEKLSGKNNHHYGVPCSRVYGNWYTKLDGSEIWLRSSYEIRVAIILDKLCLPWEYELTRFTFLDENYTYCPDFLICNKIWWEVKGFMRYSDRIKIISFLKEYPDKIFKLIYIKDIELLENYIKNNTEFDISEIGSTNL